MGVRGLQSYMEKSCPEGCHKVVIKDLIEIYRRETGREPVIVVDANSCLRHLYGKLDWVQGGQLTQYVEKGRHLVRQFERLGARLVMFFDGATVARKRATWVERRLRSLEDVYRVFDALEPAGDPAAVPDRLFQLPPELAQMSRGLFKLLCGCEVRNSIKECDEEIVEYAQRHGCFAILGQDTDYVIYGGAQYYLSMLHLDVDAMTTYNYSRWALARHLRISPDHLPMLASLIGNDLISTTDLKEFHQRLSGSYSPNLHMVIEKVAGFVRTLPTGPPMMASVPGVAHSVFGDQRWAPQLETSVRSYHVDASRPEERARTPADHWERVVARARERHVAGDAPHLLLAVMTGLPYELSTGLEDFRRPDLPPAATALRDLRRRAYGLLLHERPEAGLPAVEEWCMAGPDSLRRPDVAAALPVPGCHPGLLALWGDRSADLQDVRWALFTAAVSARLPSDHFRRLPPRLVVPAAALRYLHAELPTPVMQAWEVDALAAQAVLVAAFSPACLAQLPSHVDVRAVRLATLFQRATRTVVFLLAICGYPVAALQTMPWQYFDGKLFQAAYHLAKSGASDDKLCDNMVEAMEQLQQVRQAVFHP
ncbi:constitutive coactivator of peroxisome proliferator-activated receptor gamma-like isoform X1 [Bacillus rossius redtenbacheri]|uniref:constitutive coactivator of peroxisome proliferator-activated receptor gamma-like isoform X1 n=1 Tax=Bacillus rossius redtenbacheri TaxID=93214 RepID=UPI002FDCB059